MARFFFHFSDGKRQFTDNTGVELNGIAAARARATTDVRDLKTAMCDPYIQDLSGWTMTVTDAQGNVIFDLDFNRTPGVPKG